MCLKTNKNNNITISHVYNYIHTQVPQNKNNITVSQIYINNERGISPHLGVREQKLYKTKQTRSLNCTQCQGKPQIMLSAGWIPTLQIRFQWGGKRV